MTQEDLKGRTAQASDCSPYDHAKIKKRNETSHMEEHYKIYQENGGKRSFIAWYLTLTDTELHILKGKEAKG